MTGLVKRQVGLVVLWGLVLLSSVAVIYTSHLCRQLYADLSLLEREKNSLQVEWGRYLLEQSSWASLSRVEQMAVTKLNMQVPKSDDIVMVQW